jgi:putative DNA primase/helicase
MHMHDSKSTKATKKPITASTAKQKLLRSASRLMSRGFYLLPLKVPSPGDSRSGKKPACRHGVKDATNNFKKFKRLVKSLPEFNITLATGGTSRIVVVDIDPRNGGDATFKALEQEHGPLPKTVTVKTGGGGLHLYFKEPKKRLRSTVIGEGVDFVAEGKYIVVPPSLHGSGHNYVWAKDASPSKVAVASLPKAWLNALTAPARKTPPKSGPTPNSEPIPEGRRNIELTKKAGQLRASGLGETEIIDVLTAINERRCKPPLEQAEVEAIARSVAKYPVRGATQLADAGEQLAQAVLDHPFAGGAHLRYEKDCQFWRWRGSYWAPIDDKVLQRVVLETAKTLSIKARTKSLVQEAFALLAIQQAGEEDLLHIHDDPPPVVNCANGELWLKDDGTVDLRPHSPKTGMRHVLPVKYDPSATCPEYDQALEGIFRDAKNPGTLIKFLNELVGYVIQPRRHQELIVIFYGAGNNGKTSLSELLRHLVGPGLVYSSRVDDLEGNRFAIGNLFGKLLFVDDDIKAGTKLPDGTLKKISEAKTLTGERKFKDAFEFKCRAFAILLCNNIPSLSDLSYGMMRRLRVVHFTRIFKEHETDRHLFERVAANELPGVLNRALQGWKRLQRKGHFTKSMDMRIARNLFVAHANPLQGFIDECCEKADDSRIKMDEFYKRYKIWADDSGFTMTQTKPNVRKNVENLGYRVPRHNVGRVIRGLKFRDAKF